MIIDIILFCLFILNTYILIRLNRYLGIIEKGIKENLELTQNLKQSFKEVLTDDSFLLDDGTIKKMQYQKEKNIIYNGLKLDEETKEF